MAAVAPIPSPPASQHMDSAGYCANQGIIQVRQQQVQRVSERSGVIVARTLALCPQLAANPGGVFAFTQGQWASQSAVTLPDQDCKKGTKPNRET